MSWDFETQKAETAYTLQQIAESAEFDMSAPVTLDLEFLPTAEADTAA